MTPEFVFNELERGLSSRLHRSECGHYFHAAIGFRSDGVRVRAYNDSGKEPRWTAHAEARLCLKLTPYSEVYVLRLRRTGTRANSRPCDKCVECMLRKGVEKVYYTIAQNEYGVMRLI